MHSYTILNIIWPIEHCSTLHVYHNYLPLDNNTHSRTSIWTPKTASYGIIWVHHMQVHGHPLHAHAGMCGRRNWEGNVLWNHTAHTHIEGPRWYIISTSFRIKVLFMREKIHTCITKVIAQHCVLPRYAFVMQGAIPSYVQADGAQTLCYSFHIAPPDMHRPTTPQ